MDRAPTSIDRGASAKRLLRTATVLAVLGCVAIAAVPRAAEWQGSIRTIDGVRIVTNPATGFAAPVTLNLPELWRVGGDPNGGGKPFGVIRDIDTDSDGNVYLLDGLLSRVTVYSKDGAFIRAIGGEGEGPGRFRRPVAMFLTPDDMIAVLQAVPARIVLLTRDGQPAGEGALPGTGDAGPQMLQGGESRGGNTVLFLERTRFDQTASAWSRAGFLASVDTTGMVRCKYSSRENTIRMQAASLDEKDWDTFERRWDLGDDGKVYACNSYDDYAIMVYSESGKTERVIKRAFEHTARQVGEKPFMETVMDFWAQHIPDCKIVAAGVNKDIENIYVRDDGSLWVLNSAGARNLPAGTMGAFDVFDREGRFVKTVTLEGQGDPIADRYVFEKDRLYVVTGFVAAALSARGVTDSDASVARAPMEVISYKLEGGAITAR